MLRKLKKAFPHASLCRFCSVNLGTLPYNLEKRTCVLEIRTLNSLNEILQTSEMNWGECLRGFTEIDRNLLPDLKLIDESGLQLNGSIEIENAGATLRDEKIEMFGIIFNENNEVIWSSSLKTNGDFEGGEIKNYTFSNPILNWQKRLGCKAQLVLDPDSLIQERNVLNNFKEVIFGACELTPSVNRGDLSDFSPVIHESNLIFTLSLTNLDRLPYLKDQRNLVVRIEHYNSLNEKIFEQNFTPMLDLIGFGKETSVQDFQFAPKACALKIYVNPEFFIHESNYTNNTIELNRCAKESL